jgi:GR25 family glycosyltransferase involved in LPS biosynthesis
MDHVVYINLDHRTDRREHVEKELAALGIHDPIRFPAVHLPKNPAAGCSLSHLKCLEKAKEEGWPHVLIVEDDIVFHDVPLFKRLFEGFIVSKAIKSEAIKSDQDSWDVLLIAGNNMLPYLPHDAWSVQVLNCQTTTGYLVNAHYYDVLIENIREGIKGPRLRLTSSGSPFREKIVGSCLSL